MRTVLRPRWLVDGTGAEVRTDQVVSLAGERIEEVMDAGAYAPQPGDRTVELPDATLMPGLINNHVHLVLPGDNTPFTPWIDLQSDAALAVRAAHNAHRSLLAGITTVKDCGGRGAIVLDVRDAQQTGLVQGAAVISCGWTITMTGGHTRHFGGQVDGESDLRRMVRKLVSVGADYIKVMASGGGTPGTFAQYPSFTAAELRAIVETAHGFGKFVSTHCTCPGAILNAVEAGVDHIEHAMFYGEDQMPHFDMEVARRLADAGIHVTPTLQVDRDMAHVLPAGPEQASWQTRNREHRRGISALHELGVPLLAGSDAGWRATDFDTFWRELDELVACGLSPAAAIHAATGAITRFMGCADEYGTVETGRRADLLVVSGNAAQSIDRLQHVQAVFQRGHQVVGG